MSRSNQLPEHPCKKFIDYKGDTGQFFYYDKDAQKKVELLAPMYLVVLDELATITGFNKEFKCGIFSNEVHSTKKEDMNVRTFKGGRSLVGKYADIKDAIKAMGGSYTQSVYAMLVTEGNTELVNFRFHGASLNEWIDKKINAQKFIIGIVDFVQKQNGGIKYMAPVFKPFALSEELNAKATAMDVELQKYLAERKARQAEQDIEASNPLIDPEPADTAYADTPSQEGWEQMYAGMVDTPAGEQRPDEGGVKPPPF